jgi:hypothetical protein
LKNIIWRYNKFHTYINSSNIYTKYFYILIIITRD